MDCALGDMVVVDLSRGVAGGFCTKLLAGLGARVIKVEQPGGGDDRWLPPFLGGIPDLEKSGPFLYLHTNKESVVFDVQDEHGRKSLAKLLGRADLLIHELSAAERASADLDDATLETINPRLVSLSLPAFGESGPYQDYRANDLVLAALSGWMGLTGEPDREPIKARGSMIGACVPGTYAAVAALAALHWRDQSGKGQSVEISLMEGMLSTLRFYEATYAATGLLYKRAGQHLDYTFPCGLLPCKDGFITLVAGQDTWDLICMVMGMEDLLEEPELRSPLVRLERQEEITARMGAWLSQHTREECFHLLQQMRVVTGMVCDAREVVELEQFSARKFFVEVDHPICGPVRMPGAVVRPSLTPWITERPAPLLGEHTERVLAELEQPFDSSLFAVTPPPHRKKVQTPTDRAPSEADPFAGPLAGLRVLDLTTYMAGPFAAMTLADLGAEVIKIEAIQRLDSWRGLGGPRVTDSTAADRPWERSPLFNTQHRNKLGLTLNLNDEHGRELFKQLVVQSDVVLENYTARVMPNFGLAYEVLKEINPGIIMVSLNGLGASGPWKDYVSFAQVGESLGGIYAVTGYADGHLVHHTPMPADPASGICAATAVLAALRYRNRTGQGQRIEVAQAEVIASIAADVLMEYTLNGRTWGPVGNSHHTMAPHDAYPCQGADEWIVVTIATDDEWLTLCSLMGQPAWAEDIRFATGPGRHLNRQEIDCLLAEWTRGFSARDLMERLQAAGIAAGVVLGPKETLSDPHLEARGYWQYVDRALVGVQPAPSSPMRFSRTPLTIRRPAPLLGEHNHEVLRQLLQLDDDRIQELVRARVIGSEPIQAV